MKKTFGTCSACGEPTATDRECCPNAAIILEGSSIEPERLYKNERDQLATSIQMVEELIADDSATYLDAYINRDDLRICVAAARKLLESLER